jgi:hypothetical protein
MIRGGRSLGRIGRVAVCALAALAVAVPATAGAQSPAVDEYTLDIPGGGGSQPDDPPPSGVEASGSSGGGGGGATGDRSVQGGGAAGGDEGTAGQAQRGSGDGLRYDSLHEDVGGSGTSQPLDTSSRSAPEVVADSLTDGGMLPLIAALVVITGVGAWRVLRHRRTLTRAPG